MLHFTCHCSTKIENLPNGCVEVLSAAGRERDLNPLALITKIGLKLHQLETPRQYGKVFIQDGSAKPKTSQWLKHSGHLD